MVRSTPEVETELVAEPPVTVMLAPEEVAAALLAAASLAESIAFALAVYAAALANRVVAIEYDPTAEVAVRRLKVKDCEYEEIPERVVGEAVPVGHAVSKLVR